jgi:hypothetical protein
VTWVEVTQGIQDAANRVPLLSGRTTWVRVFLSGPAEVGLIYGRLRLSTAGREVVRKSTAPVDPSLAGDRLQLESSLNFVLSPAETLLGGATLELMEIRRVRDDSVVTCPTCRPGGEPVTFHPPSSLRVRLVGFRYKEGELRRAPRREDFDDVISWLARAYPVSMLEVDTVTVTSFAATPDCRSVNLALARIRAIDLASGADPRTHYYGLVRDAVKRYGDRGFMGGCSLGTPPWPDPSTAASGPAGAPGDIRAFKGWDDPPSYAGFYAGHEIAHTLGRRHPGFCPPPPGTQQRADPVLAPGTGESIDTPTRGFVGLDTERGVVYDPTRWTDIMTYCGYRWISGYTYQGLLDRLREEELVHGVGTPLPDLLQASDAPGDSILEVIAHFDDLRDPRGSILAAFGTWRRGRPLVQDTAMLNAAPSDHQAVVEVAYGNSSIVCYPVMVMPSMPPEAPSEGGAIPPLQGQGWVHAYVPNFPGLGTIRLRRNGLEVATYSKPAAPTRLHSVNHAPARGGTPGHRYSWALTPQYESPTVYLQASFDGNGYRVIDRTKDTWITIRCALLQGRTSARIRLVVADKVHTYLAYQGEELIQFLDDPCRPGTPSGE